MQSPYLNKLYLPKGGYQLNTVWLWWRRREMIGSRNVVQLCDIIMSHNLCQPERQIKRDYFFVSFSLFFGKKCLPKATCNYYESIELV